MEHGINCPVCPHVACTECDAGSIEVEAILHDYKCQGGACPCPGQTMKADCPTCQGQGSVPCCPVEEMTDAKVLALMLDNNGQRWETDDGRTLEDVAMAMGALSVCYADDGTAHRVRFLDGSDLILAVNGWDFPMSDDPRCFCWKGAGHTDTCPVNQPRTNVLCGCGWGRLACPANELPESCPVCGHRFLQ